MVLAEHLSLFVAVVADLFIGASRRRETRGSEGGEDEGTCSNGHLHSGLMRWIPSRST